MGCESSRVEQRNKFCDDLNTVQLNFIGGECHYLDGCPVDKFVISNQGELSEQYTTNGVQATDQVSVKGIYTTTYTAVSTQLDILLGQQRNSSAGKDPYIGGKYKLSDAISQLKSVLASFDKYSGIPCPSIKKQENLQIQTLPSEYEINDDDFSGWENLPTLLLQQAVLAPYFGDLIRAQVIAHEFNTRGLKSSNSGIQYLRAAGLMSAAVRTAEKEVKEIWFSGLVGEDDFKSLNEMVEGERPILFPGVIIGWTNQQSAVNALRKLESNGDQKTHKVILRVNQADVLEIMGSRFCAHRLSGQVVSKRTDMDAQIFDVYTQPLSDDDVKQSIEDRIEEWEESYEPRVW